MTVPDVVDETEGLAHEPLGTVLTLREQVRVERVRLDEVGASGDVLAVHSANQFRAAQHQLIKRGSLGDAAAEQQRAHGSIEEQRAVLQPVREGAACVGGGGRLGHRFPRVPRKRHDAPRAKLRFARYMRTHSALPS